MKTILFLMLVTAALAHPIIEKVNDADMPALITKWHRYNYALPKPVRAKATDIVEELAVNDVILWEVYKGQPIAKGDWFIADYPSKNLVGAIRECKQATDTSITTLAGTTIPLSQVTGIVRRVVRVLP